MRANESAPPGITHGQGSGSATPIRRSKTLTYRPGPYADSSFFVMHDSPLGEVPKERPRDRIAQRIRPAPGCNRRPVGANQQQPEPTEPLPQVTKLPADCNSKEDVRAEIDRIDQALLTLLAERHRYVTRMAEIKTDPHEAHDPARIAAVLAKQRKRAEELDLDEDQAELIWKTLIDWNVNYEKGIIAARKRQRPEGA